MGEVRARYVTPCEHCGYCHTTLHTCEPPQPTSADAPFVAGPVAAVVFDDRMVAALERIARSLELITAELESLG